MGDVYWPEMKFSIEKITVTATSRELKATYAIELPECDDWIRGPDLRNKCLCHRDTFSWEEFHKLSRRERLKMLGQSD